MRGGLISIFLFLCFVAPAQTITYPVADSISYAAYAAGKWNTVDSVGHIALRNGIDYPYLRMRMGYSCFMQNDFSASLKNYRKALKQDHGDTWARWFLYQDNRALNRPDVAAAYAAGLNDSLQKKTGLSGINWLSGADGEFSFKIPSVAERSPAIYMRAGASSRFAWKFNLYQSFAFFHQQWTQFLPDTFHRPPPGPGHPPPPGTLQQQMSYREWMYYAQLRCQVTTYLSAWGAVHLLNSTFGNSFSKVRLAAGGTRYDFDYGNLSATASFAAYDSVDVNQYEAGGAIYPFGNLNFYLSGKFALVVSGSEKHPVYTPGIGFRLSPSCWMDLSTVLGGYVYYSENNGLYIYNLSDKEDYRFSASLYFPVGKNTRLGITYSYEKLRETGNSNLYSQNSITGGISWTK